MPVRTLLLNMKCPKCAEPMYRGIVNGRNGYGCLSCGHSVPIGATVGPDGHQDHGEAPKPQKGRSGRPHKYGVSEAEDRTAGGITFDSKKEMDRYKVLKVLEKIGDIAALQYHARFPLLAKTGTRVVEWYEADFVYFHVGNRKWVIEDVKGMKTAAYRRKRRWMLDTLGLEIKET